MKIDRLLGIVMYLMNRETVSARALAEVFEVSPRTIQRDMLSLQQAGIPVTANQGVSGGYGILEGYKLDRRIVSSSDLDFIITALKGLSTATSNQMIAHTLEKVLSLSPQQPGSMQFDLSTLKEPGKVGEAMQKIEPAIGQMLTLAFTYTDASNRVSQRVVEPVALSFQWYAWYLLAYCRGSRDYRLFRLSRMREVAAGLPFTTSHPAAKELLQAQAQRDSRWYVDLKLLCSDDIRVSVEDYFSSGTITENNDGTFVLQARLPWSEQFWFGVLLSYGAKAKVLEPEELRSKVLGIADEIMQLYQ
jgi:predicted DNA-binding transcriptional regulator YafY